MKHAKLSLLLAALLALTGCATLATPIPTLVVLSPQPLRVQADELFTPLQGRMAACVPAGTALYYTNGQQPADARLGWAVLGELAAFTYTLSQQKLVLVVNPQNKLGTLSADQVRAIYNGKLQNWQQAGQRDSNVNAWGYPADDPIEDIFQEAFFLETFATGKIKTASGPLTMRKAVAQDPGAIGFLPEWWLDASVKAVSLDGMDQNTLTLPILAGTTSEPQGALKAWLLCLQDVLNKKPATSASE